MKKISKIVFVMILLFSISISAVYANTEKKEEKSEEEVWITDKKSDYATDENSSKGTVIENVDNNGKDIDVEKEDFIDVRQFITFRTKSGKTLHLIIDHSKNHRNVRLLTEVSELDLLNMLEEDEKKKLLDEDKKDIVKKEPEKVEEKPETTEKETPTKEESNNLMYIIVGLIALGVIGAGYYFKVYKNKKDDFEDEEDYDELEEDDFEVDVDDDILEELADDEIGVSDVDYDDEDDELN